MIAILRPTYYIHIVSLKGGHHNISVHHDTLGRNRESSVEIRHLHVEIKLFCLKSFYQPEFA